jgi:hypothetical protein
MGTPGLFGLFSKSETTSQELISVMNRRNKTLLNEMVKW